ncbi:protein O-mannosyl-transferase TMTC4-like [Porites lutea]|uniref:protein O-mannosyl-transferase TMTC4-like n=1 Tax=Porites lutea TaxID=51062 RepID=UPI003CC5AB92
MGCVPIINTYSDPRILCIVALWTVLLLLLAYCLCGRNLQIQRILTMGLAILAVPFLPASNIFFTVGFVVAERVLYLSSIGSCLITVLGFAALSKKYFGKKVLGLTVGALIALYMARTVQRSAEWVDEDTLFTSGLTVCPLNAKVHYNIGKLRAEKGHAVIAEKFYREAIMYRVELINTHCTGLFLDN